MIICFSEEDDDEYELIFKDGTKYIGISILQNKFNVNIFLFLKGTPTNVLGGQMY